MPASRREPLGKVRTKIVATVGPASRAPGVLRDLIEGGVDVFRLNFSHGTHEEHTAALAEIQAAAADCGRLVGVFTEHKPARAMIVTHSRGDFGHRTLFDASAPMLPGLERRAEFVF